MITKFDYFLRRSLHDVTAAVNDTCMEWNNVPPDPGGSAMAGPQQNVMGQPVSQNGTSTSGIVTCLCIVLQSIVERFE